MITEAETQVVKNAIYNAIGVKVKVRVDTSQKRQGLQIWFSNYTRQGGPMFEIRPSGLKRHIVTFSFGNYASECTEHIINRAKDEHYSVARSFLCDLDRKHDLSLSDVESVEAWEVHNDTRIEVIVKHITSRYDSEQIILTVNNVMVPLMAAIAELIGYEEDVPTYPDLTDGKEDGAITQVTINKRERNPRNRLLCIAIHGEKCGVCGLDPKGTYGSELGFILEVHHIEPLSEAELPKVYNPATDLIPLCPNCHRAIHKRTPALLPEELKRIILK